MLERTGAVGAGNDVAEAFGVFDVARFFRRNHGAIIAKAFPNGPPDDAPTREGVSL